MLSTLSSSRYRARCLLPVAIMAALFLFWVFVPSRPQPTITDGTQYMFLQKLFGGPNGNRLLQCLFGKEQSRVEVFKSSVNYDKYCAPYRLPGRQEPTHKLCTYKPEGATVSNRVHQNGVWEFWLVQNMISVMTKADDPSAAKDQRVSLVDIGCNIGTFTVAAAGLGFDSLCLEAMNTSLQLVATSLSVNNLESRVTMIHNAISDIHEDVAVKLRADGSAGHSFVVPYEQDLKHGPIPHWSTQSVVKTIIMDDLIPYVRTHRVFIKIDIEGSEAKALRGADNFFQQVDVVCVLMEWAIVMRNSDDRDFVINFLNKYGFVSYVHPTHTEHLLNEKNSSWPGNIYWLKRK